MLNFIRTFFQQLKFRALARQLRKPSGVMGSKVGQMMNKANEFLYESTLEEMKIKSHDNILEIGFGNGLFFKKILGKAPGVKVTGIDYSDKMVKESIALNQAFVGTKQLTLLQANSDKLPFESNIFNKIFCINVVYFWDNPDIHLQEVRRALKPGGTFYTTIRTKESMQQMPFTKYNFSSYTADEWTQILMENKFEIASIKIITEPVVEFESKPFQIHSICIAGSKSQH